VSQDLAGKATELGVDPHRVNVVYDGVDETVFQPGDQSDARNKLGLGSDPMVLFVGNLVPVKGTWVLLQACSQLISQGVNLTCHIIGDGPLRRDIASYIRVHKLQDRISLHGSLPHHELPDWFRAANALILPSFSEGVPNVLLEAMACGTPFVASRVGGIPEIAHLGRNRLVPPGDARILAEAIGSFLTNPSPPTSLSRVPMRSHAQSASEIAGVFERVLEARRPIRRLSALTAS
jgi:glycosyltransferase involved in cell wall biosynthesis